VHFESVKPNGEKMLKELVAMG